MTTVAFALVLISALLHAVWSAAIKGSRNPLAFNILQVLPPILVFVAILPLIPFREIPGALWWTLAATACAHAAYFWWLTWALEQGELSLVYPIARSTPAFLPLVAIPLLGEEISLGGACGIAIVVAGMWLVHSSGRLSWRALWSPGTGYAYLTLAATVAYGLFDKHAMNLLESAPWSSPLPRSIVFYFLLTTASSAIFLPIALRHIPRADLLETFRREKGRATAATTVSFIGYGLILEALRSAPVSYVVAVRQTSVLFAVAIGAFLLHEQPGRIRVAGAFGTVAGVGLIALYS